MIARKCEVLTKIGSYEAARDLLADMAPKAEAMGDRRWSATMASDLAYILMILGEAGAALPHAERARSLFLELKDDAGLAKSLHVLSGVCSNLDMNDRARELTNNLLELAESTGQDDLCIKTIYSMRHELGLDQCLQRLQDYLDRARVAGDKSLTAMCLFFLGDIYLNTGRWPRPRPATPSSTGWRPRSGIAWA